MTENVASTSAAHNVSSGPEDDTGPQASHYFTKIHGTITVPIFHIRRECYKLRFLPQCSY
jgi:hypothetical protein